MRKLLTIIYILFCLELGIFIFILPWASYWSKNYFVDHFSPVASLARNYFLRGAISGLGLADVWLAFREVWELLHPPRTPDSNTTP